MLLVAISMKHLEMKALGVMTPRSSPLRVRTETVILRTHLIEEMDGFVGRAILVRRGKVVGDVDVLELRGAGACFNTGSLPPWVARKRQPICMTERMPLTDSGWPWFRERKNKRKPGISGSVDSGSAFIPGRGMSTGANTFLPWRHSQNGPIRTVVWSR